MEYTILQKISRRKFWVFTRLKELSGCFRERNYWESFGICIRLISTKHRYLFASTLSNFSFLLFLFDYGIDGWFHSDNFIWKITYKACLHHNRRRRWMWWLIRIHIIASKWICTCWNSSSTYNIARSTMNITITSVKHQQ